MPRFIAVAVAALFATSAFASDFSRPGHDDASYGDVPRASFGVPLIQPDGVSVAGSRSDDVQYAPAAERPKTERGDDRVAENAPSCCRHSS